MTGIQSLAEHYQRDGYLRIRGFLEPTLFQQVRTALDRYIRDIAPTLPSSDRVFEADGTTVRNLWRMDLHDPFFKSLAAREEILNLISMLVHGEPVLMAVETFNKPPKLGSGVPPHQDNAYFCQRPPDVLTVWIAMDPATLENGPVHYLKGSHRSGVLPHRASGVAGNSVGLEQVPAHDESDQFVGTLAAGDALIHHCQTIHWSDPNNTDKPRCGLLLVYRGGHTQVEPQLKSNYDAARAKA